MPQCCGERGRRFHNASAYADVALLCETTGLDARVVALCRPQCCVTKLLARAEAYAHIVFSWGRVGKAHCSHAVRVVFV